MDIAIIISLAIFVLTFLTFMFKVMKDINHSYLEAKNALSEQLNILKEKNDFLSRLTYEHYLEDFTAMKATYEAKLSAYKSNGEFAIEDLVNPQVNLNAINDIKTKLDSIAKDIAFQFESKSNSLLRITNPKESEVKELWADVSGEGAPANFRIMLFTWLRNTFSSLQKDISTANQTGNWSNQQCHLLNPNSYREIYAIAIEPDKLDFARTLYEECGKRINPIIFQGILEKNNIRSVISTGKKLIRIEEIKP
jgi:hypothetical protein